MIVWTETPLIEIWNQLRYFESSANVENLLTGTTKSTRSGFINHVSEVNNRSIGIAACIKQSYEYFLASEAVSLATKPLLLYYQFLSLAKVLLLANDSMENILDPKKYPVFYHGLKKDKSNLDQYKTLGELYVQNSGGVFEELSKIYNNTILGTNNLNFKDLIQLIPDMADLFYRYYDEPSSAYRFELSESSPERVVIYFSDGQDENTFISAFPIFGSDFTSKMMGEYAVFTANHPNSSHMDQIKSKGEGTIFDNYLIMPSSSGLFHPTLAIFSAVYILSDVVRYKPDVWLEVVEGHKEGSIALVTSFCHLVQRRVPNDILQGLWNERVRFGNLARVG